MKVAFRADASLEMGAGHVMRCLTLARALHDKGHECLFISRAHSGNLNALIRSHGFALHSLCLGQERDQELTHSDWLGASQAEDARVCKSLLAEWKPNWLVVDHYALDHLWEAAVTPAICRLMVLDDLADRRHVCDLLLDQNLGRCGEDYQSLMPEHCKGLIGPRFALMRPEFAAMRETSLQRRQTAGLTEVLIALGGVDQHNRTGKILESLQLCELPDVIRFTVVLGVAAPHLQSVRTMAVQCPWPVEVLSGISDMAERMAVADLAIGAAGGSSWERCCLGLPTLLVILAENQRPAGLALGANNAALLIEPAVPLAGQLQAAFNTMTNASLRRAFGAAASRVTDGRGIKRVLQAMESPQ